MARLGPVLAMTLLLALGVMGIRSSLLEWDQAVNGGQRLSTILEGGNGLASLAALAALLARHRSARYLMIAWVVLLTATAAAAATWWGGASVWAAAVGAAATAGVGALAIRLARARLRPAASGEPRRYFASG